MHYVNTKENNYSEKYELVKIGKFLKRNKNAIEVQDDQLYKRVTIRINGGGISVRDEVFGKEIGTKNQFEVTEKQFLLSKIDARNGAFGVVPESCDKAIITGNFWTFDVDYSIVNPNYLTLFTATKHFQYISQTASTGTTNRNYLQENLFLEMQIPLPSLAIQNQLVTIYQNKLNQAQEAANKALELEKGIETYLLEVLGIEMETSSEKRTNSSQRTVSSDYKFLQMVDFKEISRWDVAFLVNYFELKSKYQTQKLHNFIHKFMNTEQDKSLRFESFNYPEQEFSYLGMEHVEKETGLILEMPAVKGNEIKSQTIKIPQNYFIYGKLRPYLNKYWFNDTENDKVICSSEFFVFSVNDKINWQYFLIVLSSIIVQKQISNNTSGVRMPRMNEELFKGLEIPLPPLSIQTEIVAHISSQKMEVKRLRELAENLRKEAKEGFEGEIFN